MIATETIAIQAINTPARGLKALNLTICKLFGYTFPTSQPSRRGQLLQNTVAGIGLLTTTAAQSRNTAQSCGFFVRAPVFGGSFGGAQARRLSSSAVVPVVQLRSSCRPRLDSCVAVVPRRQLEPHMANTSSGASAQILTHTRFNRPAVTQVRRYGRLPSSVISLARAGFKFRCAKDDALAVQKEIATLQGAISSFIRAENHVRYELAALLQRQAPGAATTPMSKQFSQGATA